MKEVTHEEQEREAWRAGVVTRMHISARNGATQLCIFEQWIAPDAGAPAHHHPVEEGVERVGRAWDTGEIAT